VSRKFRNTQNSLYKKKKILVYSTILVFLLLFLGLSFSDIVSDKINSYTSSFLKDIYTSKKDFNTSVSSMFFANNLKNQNDQLRYELAELESKISVYDLVLEENIFLRKQLNLFEDNKENLLLANINFSHENTYEKKVILNLGAKDGVKENNLVMSHNVLLGKIVKVFDTFSHLQLVTDVNSVFEVEIYKDKELSKGILQGGLGGEFLSVVKIEKTANLDSGDLVVLSRDNVKDLSIDLIIGEIEEIIDVDKEAYKTLKVKPAIDYDSLRQVFVIL